VALRIINGHLTSVTFDNVSDLSPAKPEPSVTLDFQREEGLIGQSFGCVL
jgi:hypothetical protein